MQNYHNEWRAILLYLLRLIYILFYNVQIFPFKCMKYLMFWHLNGNNKPITITKSSANSLKLLLLEYRCSHLFYSYAFFSLIQTTLTHFTPTAVCYSTTTNTPFIFGLTLDITNALEAACTKH